MNDIAIMGPRWNAGFLRQKPQIAVFDGKNIGSPVHKKTGGPWRVAYMNGIATMGLRWNAGFYHQIAQIVQFANENKGSLVGHIDPPNNERTPEIRL